MSGSFFLAILVVLQLYGTTSFCQNASPAVTPAQAEKLLTQVDAKIDRFYSSADAYTSKTLRKIIKQEKAMKRLMAKKDPALADRVFNYAIDSLTAMLQVVESKQSTVNKLLNKNYFAYTDSLKQSLQFIEKLSVDGGAGMGLRMTESIKRIDDLDAKLAKIEDLKNFVSDRKAFLKNYFKNSPAFAKHLQKINKEAYYYYAQIEEYKSVLSDPAKIELVVAKALMKIPAFKPFFDANSQLAQFFGPSQLINGSNVNVTAVNGIPNRLGVQQAIQSSFGSNVSVSQFLNQQLAGSAETMNRLKDKINQLGGMGNKDIPDFKPNSQKTKTFRQRLEYGADVQFGKAINLLPATSDVALQLGYRINDNSSFGLGISYKLGIGQGWNNIRFSHQGIGLRSYANYKIKGSFYVQGGGEMTYLAAFKDIQQLKQFNAWKASALIGLSKKYQVSKKLKGNFQILYDALHKVNMPETRPFVLRVGYNF